MSKDGLTKMDGARQKILCKILCDACDPRAFNHIFDRQHAIIRRDQVYIKVAIDEPANVMQNMLRDCFRQACGDD